MKKKMTLVFLSASLLVDNTVASTNNPVIQSTDWRWVSTLSMGPIWENGGETQTFYLTPEIEKTYTADHSTRSLFDGEIFLGLQKALSSPLLAQLGVALSATSKATLSGHIWDDGMPEFDNYTYSYKIQHTFVGLKGKLLADFGGWLIPWVSGSVGLGFNHAHDFTNTPLIYEVLPSPNFIANTKTTFSYTLGAGVQKALTNHWQVGVGYEFADWGKSNLGRAPEQTMNSGLALNHLYTNGILLNLTYIA